MLYVVILALIIIVFRNWFTFLLISSGDLGFFFKEHIVEYLNPPFMWETFRNLGFGGDSFLHQGVYFYNLPLGLLGRYLDFGVVERIIWFYPILIIGFISPIVLGRVLKIFPSRFYPLIAFIYLLNTYFLLIIGGGQLTVVFGYVAIPIVFAAFVSVVNSMKTKKILLFSLLFSFLVAFDFRLAYIFLVLVFFYFIYSCLFLNSFSSVLSLIRRYVVIFSTSLIITLGTQAYWILPYVTNYHSPTASLTSANTSTDAVTYFSFATFEHSFSLLHPLWPENIFGKVGFMRAEFLIIPILAFSSLLFLSKKRGQKDNQTLLFFVVLGIIGAFLAKGAKPPFGELYLWLFDHIPGFVMFRDPTKWYTLVALSYSVLIPFSISNIYELLNSKFKNQNSKKHIKIQKYIPSAFLILTTLYLLLLIRPAIFGQLSGTFKPVVVPKEYGEFKNFLLRDTTFSRVLWVPTMQRFSFYSDTHPAIPGRDFFNTYDQLGVANALKKRGVEESLKQSSVKYVVVPNDTQKEIFIKDREYDNKEYITTVQQLRRIIWLKEVGKFGDIIVFSLDNPKDHFWSMSQNLKIQARFVSPTEYSLALKNAKKGDNVIFSETYDSNWRLVDGENLSHSIQFNKSFNSFVFKRAGDYTVDVSYRPQEYVLPGLVVTSAFLLVIIFSLIFLNRRQK